MWKKGARVNSLAVAALSHRAGQGMTGRMIIACPACATRYVVPDSAIGVDGRTVRCAKCRHSWFQSGPEIAVPSDRLDPVPPAPTATPPARPAPSHPASGRAAPDEAPPVQTRPAPVQPGPAATPAPPRPEVRSPADEPAAPPPMVTPAAPRDAVRPPIYDDDEALGYGSSTFAHEPPFRPRRNRLKMYTMGAAAFAVLASGGIAAVAWYGLPDWAPLARQTFADAQPDLVLDFPPNRMDRRPLRNGIKFFGISGKVTNVGKERRTVPTIRFIMRDKVNHIVYQFDVPPPKRQLAPGESVTINEARTDVPSTADSVEYGWSPG